MFAFYFWKGETTLQGTIQQIIFLLLAAISVIASGVLSEFADSKNEKNRIKEQREQVLGHTPSRMERVVTSEKKLVHITKTNTATYTALLIASLLGGWIFGRLVFVDTTVSLTLAIICVVLPHAFLVLKHDRDVRTLSENLESSMRIITHEYMATNDIVKAVDDSIDIIDHAAPFKTFLVDCKMVSSNIERNLRKLESKENNLFFSRWIDQLILTQTDHTQMPNLLPILDDMNDAKTAQRQNDTKVATAWRDYFTLLFIILLSPLLIRVIQHEWYDFLISTLIGRGLMIAMLASLVWATGRAISINKTITG